ncbi:hypothetical protein [Sediminicola arcticus]|mgnify:CR=1 FL=1|jgi:hypothetical protein|uniref:Uncharacterized protein n=1 Tax=Sediminicola arcticus TaxID=1574308 RepID=A0ABV2SWC9_9FLAO
MKENIAFIKGQYSPAEAADVLLSLLNDKIKFHSVRALNLRHEQVNSDRTSEGKIRKLKEDKKIVEQLVLHAHKNGLELEINGTIEIKLVDKHHTVGA